MKVIIVALAFVAVAAAAPVESEPPKILRSESEQSPEGGYSFLFDTEDGTSRQEQGSLKTVKNEENKDQNVVVVKGSYTYTDPLGNVEKVEFEADEYGYRAFGPSIPKSVSRR